MKRALKYQIVLGTLIAVVVLTLSGVAAAYPNQATQRIRIIAHTTSHLDRTLFKLKGCTITHELNNATALSCPENVKISNSEPDVILHVLDTTSDSQIKADQVWPSLYWSGCYRGSFGHGN